MTDPNKAPTEIEALISGARCLVDGGSMMPAAESYIRRLADALQSATAGRGVEDHSTPDDLRAEGWSVAVHNDYRVGNVRQTFWLLTHPSGRWVKGEGLTDEEALDQCRSLALQTPGRQEQSASEFGVSEQTSGSADGFTLDRHSAEGAAAGDRPLTRPSWDECGHPTWHATNSDELGGNRLNLACDKCGAPGEVYWPAT